MENEKIKDEKFLSTAYDEMLLIISNKLNENEKKKLIIECLKTKLGIPKEGYIYCIYNELYEVYDTLIYKLGNTQNIKERVQAFNNGYIKECIIKNLVKVPHKLQYEFIIMFKLNKYKAILNREFFINYEKIDEEFKRIEILIETKTQKEILEIYAEEFAKIKIDEYIDEIKEIILRNLKPCRRTTEKLKLQNIVKKNKKNVKYKNSLGYVYFIILKSISKFYNKEVSILIISETKKITKFETLFMEDVIINKELKSIDIGICKNIIDDLIGNKMINTGYYLLNEYKMTDVMKVLEHYFRKYRKDELFDAYKKDRYMKNNIIIEEEYGFLKKYSEIKRDITEIIRDIIEDDNNIDEVSIVKEDEVVKEKTIMKKGRIFIDTSK